MTRGTPPPRTRKGGRRNYLQTLSSSTLLTPAQLERSAQGAGVTPPRGGHLLIFAKVGGKFRAYRKHSRQKETTHRFPEACRVIICPHASRHTVLKKRSYSLSEGVRKGADGELGAGHIRSQTRTDTTPSLPSVLCDLQQTVITWW